VAITEPIARGNLEARGRVLSALATGLAAWGLYGLVLRREGRSVAILSVLAFGLFPVMIRYGRAFQPDALMLGLVVAGMRFLDDFVNEGRKLAFVGFWLCLAAGLAVKIISAYVLVCMAITIVRPPRRRLVVASLTTLLPALAWYVYAATRLDEGSRASADNARVWGRSFGLASLLRPDTWTTSLWYLIVKSFTPLGFFLAVWGLLGTRKIDRLWVVWLGSAVAAFALISGKIHHEYYWMALAPVMAVGVALGLVSVKRPVVRTGLFLGLAAMGLVQSRSTWRTPEEWAAMPRAVAAIREVTRGSTSPSLIAPEALIYAAHQRGFRLEVEPSARIRAAGEFGMTIDAKDPLSLVEYYRLRGARFLADLAPVGEEPHRRLLHDAIRRRYNVRVDRDGVFIAELIDKTSR